MKELKPCPFCGGKAYIDVLENNIYDVSIKRIA